MKFLRVKAYAKLNLSLDVVAKLPNGYHDLCMVMQSVSLADNLMIRLTRDRKISVRTNLYYLPHDDRNIAARAVRLFMKAAGLSHLGAVIDLQKRIPVCAGLGGGSSDGAAVLRALNYMCGTKLSKEKLLELSLELGSDVPYCLLGGTMLAEGRGEILNPLPELPDCYIVIAKPEVSISTPKLFAKIECEKMRHHPDTKGLVTALETGDIQNISRRMYNVFEEVLPEQCSDVLKIKAQLLGDGALGASMSGTGSAVFGIFEDEKPARNAFRKLAKEYKNTFITRPIGTLL